MGNNNEKLGGGVTNVIRIGDTVHRSPGKWTSSVHALLKHLRDRGFFGAPQVLGFDDDGKEILSYMDGDVNNYPLTPAARSKTALISAAKLLREYHDATIDFVDFYHGPWQLDAHPPLEVICHGDYAPYNLVMKDDHVIGIIDFDTAHPGSRIWDVAYAAYRFAPLTAPQNKDGFGTRDEQVERLKLFCDSYDLYERENLITTILERIMSLVDFMRARAHDGEKAYQQCIADGHDRLYLNDYAYIKNNAQFLSRNISI